MSGVETALPGGRGWTTRVDAWRRSVEGHLSIDSRALAAVRVGLGLAILADLFLRSQQLVVFHADTGAVPRALVFEHYPWARVSLHALSGAAWWQAALFLVAAAAAVSMVAGWRTRTATVVSFVLLVSVQARNPWVLNGGDTTLTLVMFWCLFLPLGDHLSLEGGRPARRVTGLAAAGLLVLPVLIYTVNAVFKARSGTWIDGSAMRYAFVDPYVSPLGAVLARSATLLSLLGQAWFLLVSASVLLLVLRGRARGVAAALLMAGHATMLLTMEIGVFPLVSITALLPFLPAQAWDAVERRLPWRGPTGPARAVHAPERVLHAARVVRRPLLAVALVAMVGWAAASVGAVQVPGLAPHVERHGSGWAMFGNPPRAQVWYVAVGELEGGTPWDAFSEGPPPWDAPPDMSPFPDERWTKFQTKLREPEGPALQAHLVAFLCTRWEAREGPAGDLTLTRMTRPTVLDGPPAAAHSEELFTWSCGGDGRAPAAG